MAPFFIAGVVVLYGVNGFANILMNSMSRRAPPPRQTLTSRSRRVQERSPQPRQQEGLGGCSRRATDGGDGVGGHCTSVNLTRCRHGGSLENLIELGASSDTVKHAHVAVTASAQRHGGAPSGLAFGCGASWCRCTAGVRVYFDAVLPSNARRQLCSTYNEPS